MSLITLTFGGRGTAYSTTPHTFISTPEARMNERILNGETGLAVVKKACRFYSQEEIYVVAEVKEGILGNNMVASFNGKKVELIDVESKFGHSAKKGMTVGITIKGICENDIKLGDTLEFEKN